MASPSLAGHPQDQDQDQQQPSGATSPESNTSPQSSSSQSSPQASRSHSPSTDQDGLPFATILTAASVVLLLLLLRTGFFNLVLVVATSMALLVNPYVRVFLDLPELIGGDAYDGTKSKSMFGVLDPAKYFSRKGGEGEAKEEQQESHDTGSKSDQRRQQQLESLPPHLQTSLDQLAPLVIRDFVQGWYTHHSFGYPSFPRSARSTLDYMAASIWTASLANQLHSVDVATELLLTGNSVFLTCIRRKRFANTAAANGDRMAAATARRGGTGHWHSNEERISSLRSAMRAFFERHLPPSERESDLVFNLLSEVLTKQLWNFILTVGEPDFLNRTLVDWKRGQQQKKQQQQGPTSGAADSSATVAPSPALPARPASRMTSDRTSIPRPPSAAPERSLPSTSSAHGPSTTGLGLLTPDRNMISSPPSRADSPMMPLFAGQRGSVDTGSPVVGYAPNHMPTPSGSRPRPEMTPQRRTSSDLSDGFSAVVGGIGSVIKGAGKGVDAFVGGVGDVLLGPEAEELRRPVSQSPVTIQSWQRTPATVDQASSRPEVLQDQHNAIRRNPQPVAQKKDRDLTDVLASQAAWPSNLPRHLEGVAEGEDLPSSLKSSLRPLQTGGPTASPRVASPSMMSSQPYDLASPRRSIDSPSRNGFRPLQPAPVPISNQPQAGPTLPARPPSASASHSTAPKLPPRSQPETAESISLAPPLSAVLSRRGPEGMYDAFEHFLETPSSSTAAICIPGQGEELLRLQIGLQTIQRLVPKGAGDEAEMFREDASTILSKARDGLSRAVEAAGTARVPSDSSRTASAEEMVQTLTRAIGQLGFGRKGFAAKQGTVRNALEPVETTLSTQLERLYDLFCKQRASRERRASTNEPPTMRSSLAYEPRRKDRATPPPAAVSLTSSPVATRGNGAQSTESHKAPPATHGTPLRAPKARMPIIDPLIDLEDDEETPLSPSRDDAAIAATSSSSNVSVTVTDISSNADRPNAAVDTKTFEFICAVEGASSTEWEGGGGFILMRSWDSLVTLDRELRRYLQSSVSGGSAAPQAPSLPTPKSRTSATLCADVENYLVALLSDSRLSSTSPVEAFADRTKAAVKPTANNGIFNPFQSGVELGRNIGKGFVGGVGNIGKAAASGLQGVGGVAQSKETLSPIKAEPSSRPPYAADSGELSPTSARRQASLGSLRDDSAATGGVPSVAAAATSGIPTSTVASKSSQGLSARALDALLTSLFALADEALSLTGAWSMRRGVVRLLQSVVRQSYSSSIVSAFDGTASALSSQSVARWMDTARTTFWSSPGSGTADTNGSSNTNHSSDQPKWIYQKGPPRTARQRIESEEEAREILLGYAPPQSVFVLGPGGQKACERALEAVHGVICEDEGALDLVLTLVLRMLQML